MWVAGFAHGFVDAGTAEFLGTTDPGTEHEHHHLVMSRHKIQLQQAAGLRTC